HGDGKTALAIYDESAVCLYVRYPSTNYTTFLNGGQPTFMGNPSHVDVPIPGPVPGMVVSSSVRAKIFTMTAASNAGAGVAESPGAEVSRLSTSTAHSVMRGPIPAFSRAFGNLHSRFARSPVIQVPDDPLRFRIGKSRVRGNPVSAGEIRCQFRCRKSGVSSFFRAFFR